MEDEPERLPPLTAEQEAERRKAVLAERHRLRNRRRLIAGGAVIAATALVGAGAVAAWNSQAHAEFVAAGIEQWRDDRDAAECALTARVLAAVDAEEQARELLPEARAIPAASGVFGDAERAAFEEDGMPLLEAMADGAILDDADRERAEGHTDGFDADACTAAAKEERAPLGPVTAERADELARQWRSLGDPADVDDERVTEFEGALERLGQLAEATASSRVELEAVRASFEAAPAEAFDRFAEIDSAIDALSSEDAASDSLELVRLLAERAAAASDVEAIAAAAAAAEEAAAAQLPAPPAVVQPAPVRPAQPVRPAPVQPAPAPVEPAPVDPVDPEPSIPVPPEVTEPADPQPPVEPDPPVEPPVDPVPPGDGTP